MNDLKNMPEPDAAGITVIDQLAALLGHGGVSSDEADRRAWSGKVRPAESAVSEEAEVCAAPDLVAWPRSEEEVSEVVKFAEANRIPVTPAGGGTNLRRNRVVKSGILMDLKKLSRVIEINRINLTVEAQSGITCEQLESELNHEGLTLGVFPAPAGNSTLGGGLATGRGKIEDLVLSLAGVLPDGTMFHSSDSPRSATGPDLDRLIMGSEGELATITRATLAVRPLPEWRDRRSYLFEDMETGILALRLIAREGLEPSMASLYDRPDTAFRKKAPGDDASGCLLVLGFEGPDHGLTRIKAEKGFALCAARATQLGPWTDGKQGEKEFWEDNFKDGPMSLEGAAEIGCLVSAPWSKALPVYSAAREAMAGRGLVNAYISDIYPTGASFYFGFADGSEDPALARVYASVWNSAIKACIDVGGTLVRCHGLSPDTATLRDDESGHALEVFRKLKAKLDPDGLLSPGGLGLE